MKKINIALIGVLVAFMAIGLGVTVWAVCLKDDKSEPEQSSPSQPNMIEITYDFGFGQTLSENVEKGKLINEELLPEFPNVLGCEYNGWYMDSEFTAAVDIDKALETDTTLYAKYEYVTTDWIEWLDDTSSYQVVMGESALTGDIVIPNTYNDGTNGEAYITAFGGGLGMFGDLTSIVIPQKVTDLSNGALAYCSNLRSVSFAKEAEITSISAYEFEGSSLESVTIPASVTNFEGVFYSSTNLTNLVVERGNTVYTSRDVNGNECNAIIETQTNRLIHGSLSTVIPNSVTILGDEAFSGLTTLSEIAIPDSVVIIESAFCACEGLKNVTLPSQLVTIGAHAFNNCISLTSITIPSSVTTIGANAFYGCSETLTITMEDTTSFWARTEDIENPDWDGGFTHTQIAEELLTNPVYYWTKSTN